MQFKNGNAAANYCFNQIHPNVKDKEFRKEWIEWFIKGYEG